MPYPIKKGKLKIMKSSLIKRSRKKRFPHTRHGRWEA